MTVEEVVREIRYLLRLRPLHSKTSSDLDRALLEADGVIPTLLGMGEFETRVRELLDKLT